LHPGRSDCGYGINDSLTDATHMFGESVVDIEGN
jgi:hypothetical protein